MRLSVLLRPDRSGPVLALPCLAPPVLAINLFVFYTMNTKRIFLMAGLFSEKILFLDRFSKRAVSLGGSPPVVWDCLLTIWPDKTL